MADNQTISYLVLNLFANRLDDPRPVRYGRIQGIRNMTQCIEETAFLVYNNLKRRGFPFHKGIGKKLMQCSVRENGESLSWFL